MAIGAYTEPHPVILEDDSVLVVGYDKQTELYAVTYYRRRVNSTDGNSISSSKFDDLVRRRILPPGYYTGWCRAAAKAEMIQQCLAIVISQDKRPFDLQELERYIRSTSWGKDLP